MSSVSPRAARARPAASPLVIWFSAGLAALSLSACATVPSLGPKPQAKAAETYATAQSFSAPQADWPADRWWDAYNDAQLSKLVDEALAGSPTLAQAQARLRAADATVEVARGPRRCRRSTPRAARPNMNRAARSASRPSSPSSCPRDSTATAP